MSEEHPGEITRLLDDWRGGRFGAFEQLVPLVYQELHNIAVGLMRRERMDHTLQPTALLHELYFKLARQRQIGISDRNHFFTFAAKLMRMILVDHARSHAALRRGGDVIRSVMPDDLPWLGERDTDMIDLDRALGRLEAVDAGKARIVELRFFLSFTVEEIAEIVGLSKATVDRELKFIRGWLYRELRGSGVAGASPAQPLPADGPHAERPD
jgi:RNA polymerase sigma factor (TIGR02999 family)